MPSLIETYPVWSDMVDHCIKTLKRNGLRINYNQFREYYISKEHIGYMFDPFLVAKCFQINNHVRKDFDHFIIFSGKEGMGKSTMAIKIGPYIDPNFNVNNICFTFNEIKKAIKDAPKYSYILIDEGGLNLYSRDAMTAVNRELTKLFMIMRQRNIVLAFCIPNFHLLDTYIRDHRSDILFQITERGKYIAFIERGIRRVSKDGHRLKEIAGVKVGAGTFWRGNFNKDLPPNFDNKTYLARKQEQMNSFLKELDDTVDDEGKGSDYVRISKTAKFIGCTTASMRNKIKTGEIEGKKIMGEYYVPKMAHKNLCEKFKMPEN